MASNMWIKADGIAGSGKDSGHVGEVAVDHWHWGVHQPQAADAATTGNLTSSNANFAPFVFQHQMEASSPLWAMKCADGSTIPKIEFKINRKDGAGAEVPYITYTFEHCTVESVSPSGGGDAIPSEAVALRYGKFKVEYKETSPDAGGPGGSVPAGWDLMANTANA